MFPRRFLSLLVPLALVLVLLPVLAGCGRSEAEGTRYHCPMHPTYVSDRPGDCPICGMRLVPIEVSQAASAEAPSPATAANVYACPMHPEVKLDRPGKCPECGMSLEPVARPGDHASAAGVPGLAPVELSSEAMEIAGIRTAEAKFEPLARTVRTVGVVTADERRVRHVHTKIAGWIERLQVNFTGQVVRKGEPILSIYSPELLASQQELLRVLAAAARFSRSDLEEVRTGGEEMLAAARERLRLFDVPESFIRELERSGEPQRTVTLLAPVSGFVTTKSTFEGQQVEPGQELFAVTDISTVWIEADVYEFEARAVRLGQEALLCLPYDPDVRLKGRVSYVYPYLAEETRTLKVRFEFLNPELSLKPSMYADVELLFETGPSVVVPDSAVMDTGTRQIAFVERGPGRFDPREVKVGVRSGGRAQILDGVRAGERVAVRANFLLDSESRLRAAIGGMAAGHDHGEAPEAEVARDGKGSHGQEGGNP